MDIMFIGQSAGFICRQPFVVVNVKSERLVMRKCISVDQRLDNTEEVINNVLLRKLQHGTLHEHGQEQQVDQCVATLHVLAAHFSLFFLGLQCRHKFHCFG